MNMKRITTAAFAAAVSLSCSASLRADAIKLDYNDGYWRQIGYVGDIDGNGSLGAADMVLLESHLMGKTPLTAANSYRLDYDNFAVDGHKPEHSNGRFITADIDRDGKITAFDMVQLREAISDNDWKKSGYIVQEITTAQVNLITTRTTSTPLSSSTPLSCPHTAQLRR